MPTREVNHGLLTNVFIVGLAIFASFFAAMASRPVIANLVIKSQAESARIVSQRLPSIFYAEGAGETKPRIGFAAFGVPDSSPPKTETAEESTPAGSIENFKLVGTLPSVGAWIDTGDKTSLVLRDAVLDGYTLELIEPDHAVFSRETVKYPVYMIYQSQGDAGGPTVQTQAVNVPGRATELDWPAAAQPVALGNIVQAKENGEDGIITRETLNELLMNPLAEIGKMRLVPSENGMMVMRMRRDSLFSRLGVKPNDVITNINGIAISDVGNVANVISSMLSGSRFDFQVERDGEPVKLGYAVK